MNRSEDTTNGGCFCCRINISQTLCKGRGGRLVGVQSRLLPWSKAGQSLNGVWERASAQSATSTAGTSEGHHCPLALVLVTVNRIAGRGKRAKAGFSRVWSWGQSWHPFTHSYCVHLCGSNFRLTRFGVRSPIRNSAQLALHSI